MIWRATLCLYNWSQIAFQPKPVLYARFFRFVLNSFNAFSTFFGVLGPNVKWMHWHKDTEMIKCNINQNLTLHVRHPITGFDVWRAKNKSDNKSAVDWLTFKNSTHLFTIIFALNCFRLNVQKSQSEIVRIVILSISLSWLNLIAFKTFVFKSLSFSSRPWLLKTFFTLFKQ